ncbi:sugar ABC transporter substrate-binding protein [Aeromicrobium sp. A1-2]|uniref:sugar ABC transporter substrate-binding protein n=1 Tax=Aeromicrobium sp. A1-2 TaxID=2107713 RepID=UPI0013C2F252|nr:sugar ABC transporter substrate-binding protein [Aeromicrobium sp. A1-2]
MKVRQIGLGVIASLALVIMSACGGSSSSDNNAGSDGSKTYSVGIVRFAPREITTEAVINTYKDLAEKAGWEVTTANPDGAVDKAIGAMQDFVQKKVDLIIVSVFPSDQLTAGVKAAQAAGIPVASIAGGTTDGVPFGMDVIETSGQDIADLVVSDLADGGDLLKLGYKAGAPCVGREKTLDKALEGTAIKVSREEVTIPGQLDSGTRFAQAWLTKHPKGDTPLAIWACFDDPAMGALVAAKQANRTDVKIYGIDGTPAGIKAVENGTLRATAAAQPVAAGKTLFEESPRIIADGPDAKQSLKPVPYEMVTADNVADYLKTHPGANQG